LFAQLENFGAASARSLVTRIVSDSYPKEFPLCCFLCVDARGAPRLLFVATAFIAISRMQEQFCYLNAIPRNQNIKFE
jgi:hypothetical protein